MNDQELDRALTSALDVEPGADFLARVRMRVATEPAPSVWGAPLRFAAAAAVLAMAAGAGTMFWNGTAPPAVTTMRVSPPPEITAVPPAPPVVARGSRVPARAITSRAVATVTGTSLPQPLISIDDAQSAGLLAASVRSGVVADLLAPATVPEGPIRVAALEVPLLMPEPPIQVDRVEAGERQ